MLDWHRKCMIFQDKHNLITELSCLRLVEDKLTAILEKRSIKRGNITGKSAGRIIMIKKVTKYLKQL